MNKFQTQGLQPALNGMRVLLVEDEALVAMLVEDVLVDAGAKVVGPVGSVAEALQIIETAMRDGGLSAAVLDLNLAGENAGPIADALERLGVPYVFETGYSDECPIGTHSAAPILH